MTHTHVTAPTLFAEANGIRFAYRRFGEETGVPLLFMQHFRGGLDHWDPAVTDGFGQDRPVILFDNAGVASSSGETPGTVDAMADHARDFVNALGVSQLDLLGFSIGGYVAQAFTSRHPNTVRRLILVGTGPRGGEPSTDPNYKPYATATDPTTGEGPLEAFLYLFFSPSPRGQAAGRAFWERRHRRQHDVDRPSSPQTMAAQSAANADWRDVRGPRFAELRSITPPTLVVNGSKDVMIPTINSYSLSQHIPKRPADHLPGRGARLAVSVPRAFPGARADVPRAVSVT
jgi:pimeloyl-ACP methyl ester carboxylesterase